MKSLLVWLGFMGTLSLPGLWAQFPNTNTNTGGGFGGGATLPGGVNGFANPNADANLFDSTQGELPKIKPNTRYIDRKNIARQEPARFLLLNNIETAFKWDELDFAQGFTRNLGQIGKPHQVLRLGFDERFQTGPQWRDPITGQVNHYITNAESQVLYLDTRTPFVEVDYLQGPDRLQRTDVTVSQNINARLNFTIDFERRLADGVYRSNTTDETVTYLSSNYRTKDGRLESFANVHYSNLSNQIHGGTPRPQGDYTVVDGVIQENPLLFPAFFFKGGSAPILSEASRRQTVYGAYLDNYYHLVRDTDSTERANKLTIRQTAAFEQNQLRFVDVGISRTALENNLIPVYPTLDTGTTSIYENYLGRSYYIGGEINYRLEPRPGYRLWLQGGLTYRRNALIKDQEILVGQNMTEQRASGSLELPFFEAKASLYQGISDAFAPARNLTLEASLLPVGRRTSFVERDTLAPDSTMGAPVRDRKGRYRFRSGPRERAPLKVFGSYSVQAVNPTLFQAYFVGDSGNAFTPNPDLVNQGMTFLRVGARWEGATPVRLKDTLRSSYAELALFLSQSSRFIYYDQSLNPLQAVDGATLRWIGAEFKSRTRLPLRLYLETDVSAQIGTATGDPGLERYAQYLPQIYGTGALYYESSRVSFAEKARIGIEARGQTSFVGQTLDPVSGEFFPTDYQVPAYIQLNAFASLQIRGVSVYVRYLHANEGFFAPGYYTTPFYPMQEASLTLGVIWQFFN